jgi:hypothetical protein
MDEALAADSPEAAVVLVGPDMSWHFRGPGGGGRYKQSIARPL